MQPYPDVLLDRLTDQCARDRRRRYESREAISLAFVTALQLLPPNQRAVLLLRDVLGYRAAEAADLLGMTEDAVTSALKRARATMDAARTARRPPAHAGSAQERELTERFVAAFTELDIDALIALMTEDAWVKMPPLPFEYRGRSSAHASSSTRSTPAGGRSTRWCPSGRTASPHGAATDRDPVTGILHGSGVFVVAFAGDQISEIIRFEATVAPYFGLPRTLDG